jgi:hypothetical protein
LETKFIEGALPEGYRCEFDPYLFNEPRNLTIQSSSGWHSFYALRSEKKVARARVHFHIDKHEAHSPHKNPFGSFEFSEGMAPKEFYDFIRWVEAQLIVRGVKRIEIKSYPHLYNSNCSSILTTFLINLGYRVKNAEVNSCIEVNPTALYQAMSSWEKRKSGQIKRTTLRFSTVPVTKIKDVFDFISSCREERKQSLSMTYGQMKTVSDLFPDKFCLFGIYENNALAAASISIMINKTILYNFYSAHAKQYDSLSPVVRLMEGIYEHCQHEKVRLIDLGTSALQGRPNFSLLDFKLNLGAYPTQKLVFEKVVVE